MQLSPPFCCWAANISELRTLLEMASKNFWNGNKWQQIFQNWEHFWKWQQKTWLQLDSSHTNLHPPAWCIIKISWFCWKKIWQDTLKVSHQPIVQCWHNLLQFCDFCTVCLLPPFSPNFFLRGVSWGKVKLNCWRSRTCRKNWRKTKLESARD